MLKNYTSLKYAIVFLVISITCVLAYNASGQYIDRDGVCMNNLALFLSAGCSLFLAVALLFIP